jgi:hypothetical protein
VTTKRELERLRKMVEGLPAKESGDWYPLPDRILAKKLSPEELGRYRHLEARARDGWAGFSDWELRELEALLSKLCGKAPPPPCPHLEGCTCAGFLDRLSHHLLGTMKRYLPPEHPRMLELEAKRQEAIEQTKTLN